MTSTQGDAYLFDALNENISMGLSEVTIQELLEDRQRLVMVTPDEYIVTNLNAVGHADIVS